jgi:hypothetical protein
VATGNTLQALGKCMDIDGAAPLTIARDLGIDVIPGIITYHAESTIPELRDTLDLIDGCDIDRPVAAPDT